MKRKNLMGFFIGLTVWLMMTSLAKADVKVANVSVKPRWPWNGKVDVIYYVVCDDLDEKGQPCDIHVDFMGYDAVQKKDIPMVSLTGDGVTSTVKSGGPYKVTWDASQDYTTLNTSAFQVKIHACLGLYMVVDLSKQVNAISYPIRYTDTPPDLNDDTCRKTELWLRRVPAGKFLMGTPGGGLTQHEVTLTKTFYIGVFECTKDQYWCVMNQDPTGLGYGTYPVTNVGYSKIRGKYSVESQTFIGRLQVKTGLIFELPTEAQWEYAAKGGSESATYIYAGSNDVKEVAWYNGNSDNHLHDVGKKKPNSLGLYDMSGNVWEYCLDWFSNNYSDNAVTDPYGPDTEQWVNNVNQGKVIRSGSCFDSASNCYITERNSRRESAGGDTGFRVICIP